MVDLNRSLMLAQWSALTYEDAISDRALDFGLRDLCICRPKGEEPSLAVVGTVGPDVVAAFRGTVTAWPGESYEKWKLMLQGWLYNSFGAIREENDKAERAKRAYGAALHSGFAELVDSIWEQVYAAITDRLDEGRRLWLTGHSKGGALAALAAFRLEKEGIPVAGVVTFGAPRATDEAFLSQYTVDHLRFERGDDIVPLLPPGKAARTFVESACSFLLSEKIIFPMVDFRHVGKLVYISSDGEIEGSALDDQNREELESRRLRRLLVNGWRFNCSTWASDHALDGYKRALHNLVHHDVVPRLEQCRHASSSELENLILSSHDEPLRVNAIQEVGRRGFATPAIYQWLRRRASEDSDDGSPAVAAEVQALRAHSLQAVAMLDAVEHLPQPVEQLASFSLAERILADASEPLEMRTAASWALAVLNRNRPHVAAVRNLLLAAVSRRESGVSDLASDALEGRLPLPQLPLQDVSWLRRFRCASLQELREVLDEPITPANLQLMLWNKNSALAEIGYRGFCDQAICGRVVYWARFDTQPPIHERRGRRWRIGKSSARR